LHATTTCGANGAARTVFVMRFEPTIHIALAFLFWLGGEVLAQPGAGLPAGQAGGSSAIPAALAAGPSFDDVELPDELALEDVADGNHVTRAAALESALQDNPTIKAARERLEVARGTYRSRSAGNNPQLSLGATVVPRSSSAGDAAVSQFPDTDQTHLSHTFLTSGRRTHATRSAAAQLEGARMDLVTAELDLRQFTTVAYVDLQVAQDAVGLYEDTWRVAAALVTAARQQFQAGAVPEANVLRAEVEASRATQYLVRSHADLAVKQAALSVQMGRPLDQPILAVDALEPTTVALTQAQAAGLAHEHRPEVASARAQAAAFHAEVEVARSARRPDLTLQVHPASSLTNAGDPPIFAAVALPLWDRGQIGGSIDAARAQARAAAHLVDASRRLVGLDVVKAYQQLIASQKNLQLIRTQVKAKTHVILERARIAYAAGSATLLDLLDAQRVYRQAALDELQAAGDLERGIAALERAMAAPVPRRTP
ncbi:MAG: TolC family protein, partial [Chloroflexota bacterium]